MDIPTTARVGYRHSIYHVFLLSHEKITFLPKFQPKEQRGDVTLDKAEVAEDS